MAPQIHNPQSDLPAEASAKAGIRNARRLDSPAVWCFTTYFAEGLPYAVIRLLSSFFLRDMHVSLQAIGLTSLFGIPWSVKFLWGPFVDRFGTKRQWMLIMQGTLVCLFAAAGLAAPMPWGVRGVVVLFMIASFVAATHDIAIDGYYLEALDSAGQAKYVGYRVMAYRIAMMTGTGVIATIGATRGWLLGFVSGSVLLGVAFGYHLLFLPRCEQPSHSLRSLAAAAFRVRTLSGLVALSLAVGLAFRVPSTGAYRRAAEHVPLLGSLTFSSWVGIGLLAALIVCALMRKKIYRRLTADPESFYGRAFLSFMDRPRIGVILSFIILLRTGEFLLSSMVSPFMVDLGIKAHYGWISGGVGLPASIVGAMLGGWMISRFGLRRVLWPFIILQNATNLVYMALAFYAAPALAQGAAGEPVPAGASIIALTALVHGFDQFAGGLGTSVLMTYLMRLCLKEFKAAHYAIGSGLMSFSGIFTGAASGFLAEWLGYGWFFGISFVASVPGMLLAGVVMKDKTVGSS